MLFVTDKIKKAFGKVSKDITSFKGSMQEWVIFLDGNQRKMKTRITELERRLARLEMTKLEELKQI